MRREDEGAGARWAGHCYLLGTFLSVRKLVEKFLPSLNFQSRRQNKQDKYGKQHRSGISAKMEKSKPGKGDVKHFRVRA